MAKRNWWSWSRGSPAPKLTEPVSGRLLRAYESHDRPSVGGDPQGCPGGRLDRAPTRPVRRVELGAGLQGGPYGDQRGWDARGGRPGPGRQWRPTAPRRRGGGEREAGGARSSGLPAARDQVPDGGY